MGETGTAYTDINKQGKISIHGEIWDAYAAEPIKKNEPVIVEKVRGLKLKVKKSRKPGERYTS